MNENCKGCTSLMKDKTECLYTKVGADAYPDCPCQACLVKAICYQVCDDLMKVHKLHYQPSTIIAETHMIPRLKDECLKEEVWSLHLGSVEPTFEGT